MDPSNNTFNLQLQTGQMVTVTEDVPGGWILDDIQCGNPNGVVIGIVPNGRSFECLATSVGSANCTFFNRMEEPPPPTPSPVTGVPSLNEWSLLSLAVVLGIVGIAVFRLSKKTA